MKKFYTLPSYRPIVILAFFLAAFHSPFSFSQTISHRWSLNPYDEKVFVENNGQFAGLEQELGCKILFCFEQGNTAYFLCRDQFIVREETSPAAQLLKDEKESDPASSHYPDISFSYLRFIFSNANSSVSVAGELKAPMRNIYHIPDSLHQGGAYNNIVASSFKKVVYKNIYYGIDIIFSAHEKYGMKYEYIVHPFADASLIGIQYKGITNLRLDDDGNIHASAGDGAEAIDHAPTTFYADDHAIISSAYNPGSDAYSITTGPYDHNRTIIIDPWVVNPNFTNQNRAFDITRDTTGNVYVFGGHQPWSLKKFSPNGNLIWTFNTSFNSWYGALAVDQVGNSFITEGCCGGNIQKIDSSGKVRWTKTYGTQEFWRLLFNCDFSRLYLAMGYASGSLIHESISILDTSNGNINNSTAMFGVQSEPRALALGPNGNVYTITCATGTDSNQVSAMSPSFVKLFTYSDGYALRYNGPLYANGTNTTSGQNAIACGNSFFCTSNGDTLYKRNLSNGLMIASAIIPGGGSETNSGILIDNCNHIYAGSSNSVVEFDSSLNVISTTPTSGVVYCLAAGKNGELLACGDGFIASIGLSLCGGLCDSLTSIPLVADFTSSDTAFCTETGKCINFFDHSTGSPTSWQWIFTGGVPGTSNIQNPDSICYSSPGTYPVTLIVSNGAQYDTLAVSPLIIYGTSPLPPTVNLVGNDTLVSSHAASYQWYFNGAPIPGAIDSFYIASKSGTYAVQITDSLGCTSISGGLVFTGTYSSLSEDSGVLIHPNPVVNGFNIVGLRLAVETNVEVYSAYGEKVYSNRIEAGNNKQVTINCQSFASGIYFVKINNTQMNWVGKFVKE